jgi:hypothetical protein
LLGGAWFCVVCGGILCEIQLIVKCWNADMMITGIEVNRGAHTSSPSSFNSFANAQNPEKCSGKRVKGRR